MACTGYSLGSDIEIMVDAGQSDIRCQPCTVLNKSTVATLFCEGCNEYLCQDCSKGHVIYSVTQSHILVPAEAARNKPPIVDLKGLDHCNQHKKALKFYCKDENQMCCSTCAIVVHRKCEDVIEIGAMPVEEVYQKCLTVKEKLVELKEKNSSTIGYLKIEVIGIDKQNEELAKELDSMRIKIIHRFDEFAADMLQELSTIRNKKVQEFETISSKCSSLDTSLSHDIHLCDNVEQHGTSVQKYVIQHKLQESFKDYLNTTLQLESNIVTTDIMLVYEDWLKLLTNSRSTLGSLKVSEYKNILKALKASPMASVLASPMASVSASPTASVSASPTNHNMVWKHSNLVKDTPLLSYVMMQNVPRNSKAQNLKDMIKCKLPSLHTDLIYYEGETEALVICNNSKDAHCLVACKNLEPHCFSEVTPVLGPFIHVVNPDLITALRRTEFDCFVEHLHSLKVTIQENDKSFKFFAPTSYQMECAVKVINEYEKEKKRLDSSGYEHVCPPITGISMPKWDVLNEEMIKCKSKVLTANYNSEKETVTVTYTDSCNPVDKDIYNFARELQQMDMVEIPVPSKLDKDVKTICTDVNKEIGERKCCTFIKQKNVIVAYHDHYEQLNKIKHLIIVKLGLIKLIGQRGKKLIENSASSKTDSVRDQRRFTGATETSNTAGGTQKALKDASFWTPEGIEVKVYVASILSLPVDCIVNAANNALRHGDGVARAIADAAGSDLTEEGNSSVKQYGKIAVGEVRSTTAGNLPYKRVIHAVVPDWKNYKPHSIDQVQSCEKDLYSCIYNSFMKAETFNLQSIALPAISSAIFGVPEELCIHQYVKATMAYSKENWKNPSHIKKIHFVDINKDIIRSIHYAFAKWLQSTSEPPYDSYQFFKPDRRSTQNTENYLSKTMIKASSFNIRNSNVECKDAEKEDTMTMEPEPLSYEENKMFVYLLCGTQNEDLKLCLSEGDMFNKKASAIVIPTNKFGEARWIMSQMTKCLSDSGKSHYNLDKTRLFTKNISIGDVVKCPVRSDNVKYILHAVIDLQSKKTPSEKCNMLENIYSNVFKLAGVNNDINSIVTSLIGIDDSHDEIELCANAFWNSYTIFCNEKWRNKDKHALVVHLFCYTNNIFNQVVDLFNKQIIVLKKKCGLKMETTCTEVKKTSSELNTTTSNTEENEDCAICLDKVSMPRKLKCGHTFCSECIDNQFKFKKVCPLCSAVQCSTYSAVCGIISGDQPNGTYDAKTVKDAHCAGHEDCGCLAITYTIYSGHQGPTHPNPGKPFKGITRTGYLPDNKEGRIILAMLKIAFERKLVFTIGRSRTTGEEDVVIWNDIHHKTDLKPRSLFGYPDPTYLQRVKDELASKGVTENDLPTLQSHSGH